MRSKLTEDALKIWNAGVAAVQPETLFKHSIAVEQVEQNSYLRIEGTRGDLFEADIGSINRIWVVGGGKAGSTMARALGNSLGEDLLEKFLAGGILSVPGGTELPQMQGSASCIQLVAGRPAGVNAPRPEGQQATKRMLQIVDEAASDDLVICLLSGGASALLPQPSFPVTLDQKCFIAKQLAACGATIEQLNIVRQHLSDFKGGGLARACKRARLLTLVISDVPGDDLSLIGSGPTVMPKSTPQDASKVLVELGFEADSEVAPLFKFLESKPTAEPLDASRQTTILLANNATAVDAAGMEAERLGYNHAMTSSVKPEGEAKQIGKQIAQQAITMRDDPSPMNPNCLISGGEPVVTLNGDGLGGRNQELVLAALESLHDCKDVAILSGGTDGEDGPTDAAGAFVDESVVQLARQKGLSVEDYLARNDSYRFFEPIDALLKSGPTGTNVCDLRVVTVNKKTPR